MEKDTEKKAAAAEAAPAPAEKEDPPLKSGWFICWRAPTKHNE